MSGTTTQTANAAPETPNSNAQSTSDVIQPAGAVVPAETEEAGSEEEHQPDDKANQIKDRIKRAERSAQQKLLEQLGVTSLDEAKALKEKAEKADLEKLTEKERLEKERNDALKAAEQERKHRERLERDVQEKEAQQFLRTTAMKAGVEEDALDLVLVKMSKHIEENFEDDAELKSDDFKSFFGDLRKDKKLWFKPTERPANSAVPNNDTSPTTPSPNKPSKPIEDMNDIEWAAHKQANGWT